MKKPNLFKACLTCLVMSPVRNINNGVAYPCPVEFCRGRWGWPCLSSLADVTELPLIVRKKK